MDIIAKDTVLALLGSTEKFPVDFDDAFIWWDCRTKKNTPVRRDNLIRKLRSNFIQDTDYCLLKIEERSQHGFEADKYFMTVECFQMMGMMLVGEKGRQIREYFIKCEDQLKKLIAQSQPQPTPEPPTQPKRLRPELPVIMPTPEQIEFMKSPSARSHPNWQQQSGYDKVFEAVQQWREESENLLIEGEES